MVHSSLVDSLLMYIHSMQIKTHWLTCIQNEGEPYKTQNLVLGKLGLAGKIDLVQVLCECYFHLLAAVIFFSLKYMTSEFPELEEYVQVYTAFHRIPAPAKEKCSFSTGHFPWSWSCLSWNLHSYVGPLDWHGLRKKQLMHSCLACFPSKAIWDQ